jgi:hypothetical protein
MDASMPSKLPLLVLLLFASLLLAGTARAAPNGSTVVPFALEEELEFEGEEEAEVEEVDACATAAGELAEGELTPEEVGEICAEEASESKGKKTGPHSAAGEECILRSTHASAAVDDESNKLKLTLGYTAYEPTKATILLRSGSIRVGSFKRHLGRSGVLRFTKTLGEKQGRKQVLVDIQLPSVRSAGCPSRRLVLFPH